MSNVLHIYGISTAKPGDYVSLTMNSAVKHCDTGALMVHKSGPDRSGAAAAVGPVSDMGTGLTAAHNSAADNDAMSRVWAVLDPGYGQLMP